jgi:type I restriction enzyme M protein
VARQAKSKPKDSGTTANLGFEAKMWVAADAMRNNMDPAEYKHVVLGLIFLKYVNDAFAERRAAVEKEGDDPEEKDQYRAYNVFWVPPEARWEKLAANATQPTIGRLVDDAMIAIERDNPKQLKGVLPKTYGRAQLDKQTLGKLINLIGTIALGDAESKGKDVLGRVYEYFLGRFASAEGKGGGEFYTPASVVRLLVEMLEPYHGRVMDPCCGSGGMFVQSRKFVEAHGGRRDDISIYGQELNPTTWQMCKMNLAIRGIEADLGEQWADCFTNDQHKDVRADYILANPPFNISDWKGELLRDDPRWKYGAPPVKNANYAWVQHFIHHLAPDGTAGFVLANGSMSSDTNGEGDIRQRIVEADLVDCMVALPGQLFYSTPIQVCLWFITKNKGARALQGDRALRDRRHQTLLIDARDLGELVDRTHRELSDKDIRRIADTYHAWRGEKTSRDYADEAGFCKSVTTPEIQQHRFLLVPGRYVGSVEGDQTSAPLDEILPGLLVTLRDQLAESDRLRTEIDQTLRRLGLDE